MVPQTITAAIRTLAIPELLEAILVHLRPIDILRCERVNTFFNKTIKGSIALQIALFRREAGHLDEAAHNEPPVLNPLLLQRHIDMSRLKLPPIFAFEDGNFYAIDRASSGYATNPYPVIEEHDQGEWHLQLEVEDTSCDAKELTERPDLYGVLYKGSWENMLLSQPVCDAHVRIRVWPAPGCYTLLVKGGSLREMMAQFSEVGIESDDEGDDEEEG